MRALSGVLVLLYEHKGAKGTKGGVFRPLGGLRVYIRKGWGVKNRIRSRMKKTYLAGDAALSLSRFLILRKEILPVFDYEDE